MLMRKKPIRGERVKSKFGYEVTLLEDKGVMVKCINDNGLMEQITKDNLELPVIDTKEWERVQ